MTNNDQQLQQIRLLQWNIHGIKSKPPLLQLALAEQRYDIVILQEILLQSDISLSHYTGFHKLHTQGLNRGISILVRCYVRSINPLHSCGPETEFQGLSVTLQDLELRIFNIYRPQEVVPNSILTTYLLPWKVPLQSYVVTLMPIIHFGMILAPALQTKHADQANILLNYYTIFDLHRFSMQELLLTPEGEF